MIRLSFSLKRWLVLKNNKENINIFPVTQIQRQFWIIQQMDPENTAYLIVSLLRIKGKLKRLLLEKSINLIIEKHDVFRTQFKNTSTGLKQIILPSCPITIHNIEVKDKDKYLDNDKLSILLKPYYSKPFDLKAAPLLRCYLFKIEPEHHVLLFVFHHSIFDLKTQDLFSEELVRNYILLDQNEAKIFLKNILQYSYYALWQQNWLKGDECANMVSYWKNELRTAESYLDLPHDKKRPTLRTMNGTVERFSFSNRLMQQIKSYSKKTNNPIFLITLTAYYILLYIYSRKNDITVGIPFTNRRKKEFKDMMGCFVNMIPLYVNMIDKLTFNSLLLKIRRAMLRAHRNQEVPFETLVNAVDHIRDNSYNPLFQTGFTFIHPMHLELPGMDIEPIYCHHGGSQFDLFLTFWEGQKDKLSAVFEYNSDIFYKDTISRMINHFKNILAEIIKYPDQNISDLQMLSIAERDLILKKWNNTKVNYRGKQCIHRLFEQQVKLTPNRIAIEFNGQQLTYRELNERSNQLGHYLQGIGVGPDVLVGIALERSVEMVIGIYGILKAGGCYVPIDPTYPIDRINYYIEDSKLSNIISQSQYKEKFKQFQGKIIYLDKEWDDLISDKPKVNLTTKATLNNLAYVIYTSGSTGNPKGAMNPHKGILNRLFWMQDMYHIKESDHLLHKTPLSFDISVWELFWPLMFGAKIVIARPEGHKDNEYLLKTIIEKRITIIHFVPSMLRFFLELKNVEKCKTLRQVICSGEALTLDLQDQFFNRINAKLDNLYGVTEAAVEVTYWRCRPSPNINNIPIGRPIANTQIYILDNNMNPVPIGVPGELHIGGIQVGRGYLNRPELTKQKFIQDPFGNNPDNRLYKSGDLARYLPDGNIEYIDRIDNQVKIRGFRVELGEIETILNNFNGISQAVVVINQRKKDDQRLIAYIVCESNIDVSILKVRDYLKTKLPEYMIPHFFMKLKSLPISPNGKLDRKSLPIPRDRQVEHSYRKPRDHIEKRISEIWKSLLDIEKVGIQDTFFELGGHSLLLMKMLHNINTVLNVQLSIVDLFKYPTIQSLANFLKQSRPEKLCLDHIADRAQKRRQVLRNQKEFYNARKKIK